MVSLGIDDGEGFGMGEGEAAGICMPGIVSFGGIDDGEGFGVGEGVAIAWPGCCASTGQKAKRIIEIGNNSRSILKLPPRKRC